MPFQTPTGEPNDLVQTTVARHRLIRIYWLLMAVLPLAIFALVASLLTYTIVRHESEVNNQRAVKSAKQAQESRENILILLERINSCTTPEGECSKRGAESGVNLSAAITYCTLNLPPRAQRDTVTSCIVNEVNGGPE